MRCNDAGTGAVVRVRQKHRSVFGDRAPIAMGHISTCRNDQYRDYNLDTHRCCLGSVVRATHALSVKGVLSWALQLVPIGS